MTDFLNFSVAKQSVEIDAKKLRPHVIYNS